MFNVIKYFYHNSLKSQMGKRLNAGVYISGAKSTPTYAKYHRHIYVFCMINWLCNVTSTFSIYVPIRNQRVLNLHKCSARLLKTLVLGLLHLKKDQWYCYLSFFNPASTCLTTKPPNHRTTIRHNIANRNLTWYTIPVEWIIVWYPRFS